MHGDMCRYLMNGAFFYDLMKDFPLNHPVQYTLQYFARYPALSIGHHSFLLGLVEAPAYAIFGMSVFSARLVIVCFFLLGIAGWYLLIGSLFNRRVAFFSSLLMVTNYTIIAFSRLVMSEIPALALLIISVYFLERYLESNRNRDCFLCLTTLLLGIVTRYQLIAMIPLFLVYLVYRKGIGFLFYKRVYVPVLVFILFLFSLVLLVMKYSTVNMMWLSQGGLLNRFSPDNLLFTAKMLIHSSTMAPVLCLAILSGTLATLNRDRRLVLFGVWVLLCFFQLVYIRFHDFRYAIYLLPPLFLLSAWLPELLENRFLKRVSLAAIIALTVYQFAGVTLSGPERTEGYEQAARYVVENRKGGAVLFSSAVDTGYFIFFVRKHDPGRKMIILRADKMLVTSCMDKIVEERVTSREEIYDLLKDYGVAYVVFEDTRFDSPPLEWLREEVKSERFILRKSVTLDSTRKNLKHVELKIYEFKDQAPPKPGIMLDLHIPLMAGSIEVNYDDLLRK